jgi:hypothetical protein
MYFLYETYINHIKENSTIHKVCIIFEMKNLVTDYYMNFESPLLKLDNKQQSTKTLYIDTFLYKYTVGLKQTIS